jgi:hypothetical protein
MDQQINKRYRWSPGTIEALQRIAAIDGDLSENLLIQARKTRAVTGGQRCDSVNTASTDAAVLEFGLRYLL